MSMSTHKWEQLLPQYPIGMVIHLETKSHCQIKFHSQHTWDTSSNSVVIFFLNVIVTKHIDPLL